MAVAVGRKGLPSRAELWSAGRVEVGVRSRAWLWPRSDGHVGGDPLAATRAQQVQQLGGRGQTLTSFRTANSSA